MNFQFTYLRYYQVPQLRSKHIFLENSKKMKFLPKKRFEKPFYCSLNIMILQLVKFLIMDFWKDFLQQVNQKILWLDSRKEFKKTKWIAWIKKGVWRQFWAWNHQRTLGVNPSIYEKKNDTWLVYFKLKKYSFWMLQNSFSIPMKF
jgi:hypothetical protein